MKIGVDLRISGTELVLLYNIFENIAAYSNSAQPWRLKAFSVLFSNIFFNIFFYIFYSYMDIAII